MQDVTTLRMSVFAAVFAALIAVGAYLSIPLKPVPIVLQNLFVLLAGLVLGPTWGSISVLVYLAAGAVGLPVFAGGTGGLAKFAGPTGGYLVGFLAAAWITGWVSTRKTFSSRFRDRLAVITGSAVIYALGVPWLKYILELSWSQAVGAGMLPFLPGTLVKMAAALLLAEPVRRRMNDRPEFSSDGRS
ncbi:MAG: BioY family transporter [Deltaproteobacteria bacterium]|nr:MAG: BioY family transporter [Deltaproteobacteria bacterium]